MTRNIAGAAEGAFRICGAAFNCLLMAGFLYAAFRLYGYGSRQFADAGSLVSLQALRAMAVEPSLASQWITGLLAQPGLAARLGGYAAGWFALIGSAGFAWMALLGLRWFYHALLRTAASLR